MRHARIPARHSTSHKIYKIPENAATASRREEHSDSQPTGVFCVQKIRIRPAGCRTNSHIFMTSAAERNLSPAACMGRTQPDRPFSFSFRPPRLRDALPCGTDKLFSKSGDIAHQASRTFIPQSGRYSSSAYSNGCMATNSLPGVEYTSTVTADTLLCGIDISAA